MTTIFGFHNTLACAALLLCSAFLSPGAAVSYVQDGKVGLPAQSTRSAPRAYAGIVYDVVKAGEAESMGLKKAEGVIVTSLAPGGPAEKARVEPGDVILRINSKDIAGPDDLSNEISTMSPGEAVVLRVVRNGDKQDIRITLGVAPPDVTSEPKVIKQTKPTYPASAIASRVEGTVRLTFTISPEGRVKNVQVVSGPGELIPAAVEAVNQWLFEPALFKGTPFEAKARVDVPFKLGP